MIEITLNMGDFERAARSMGAAMDQIPFALSQSLNDAARVARTEIVDKVWPQSVEVKNRRFMGWMMRTDFASKRNLKVRLYNREPREFLPRQAEGGTKIPHRSTQIAIPASFVKQRRGSGGIPERFKPRNAAKSFRKGNAIFQRISNDKLRLLYTLKGQARVQKRFPAHETWDRVMRTEVMNAFGPRMLAAMRTRR
jgi:hypothetical protein